MDKVTGQCPQTTAFLKSRKAEAVSNRGPSAYQPNALPLGLTGSQHSDGGRYICTKAGSEEVVQELCESRRGGRPGLSVLTSLLVSVDVKIY